jgi:hypothetical protein
MRFIVTPVAEENPRFPNVTHCVLCSEDPRWCPPTE